MTGGRALLGRAPALLVGATGVLLALLATIGIGIVLVEPYPLKPWDAGAVMEGWRAATGMPVYEPPDAGHATHMYGALAPYALGAVLRLTGPSNLAPKLLSLACALALGALLLTATARLAPRRWWMSALLVGMFLCLDSRADHYFVSARPDLIELFVAGSALALMYRGAARERFAVYAGGAALLAVAFLFKQPAAFLSGIPALALLLERDWPLRRRLLWGAVPPAAIVATLGALRVGAPTVYLYMVTIPSSYSVPFLPLYPFLTGFLRSFPPLWVVALAVAQHWGELLPRREWRWAAAAVVVTIPTSLPVAAKVGGGQNAWLPALLALLFALALALPRTFAWLEAAARPLSERTLAAVLLSAAAFLGFGDEQLQAVRRRPHVGDHRAVVAATRALPRDAVLSPGDPTISLLAHGEVERTFALELDARPVGGWWMAGTPAVVRREIEAARYVVLVDSSWGPMPFAPLLDSLGFAPSRRFGIYEIRERRAPPPGARRQTPSTDFPTR